MTKGMLRMMSATAVAMTLAACGGGGGTQVAVLPPPPPPPTPTPTPVNIFPHVEASTEFATLGIEASRGPSPSLTTQGFSVRYDASQNAYFIDVPGRGGEFREYPENSPHDYWWGGGLYNDAGNWLGDVLVLKPANPELTLTYTTLAHYDLSMMNPEPFGWVAFGMATPAGAVPVTGTATYDAIARGSSVDDNGWIEGSATLDFNFASGQLAGHFEPVYFYTGGMGESYPLGRYDFVNTVYSSGATDFSGQLANGNFDLLGSFHGLFTGPDGQELMARWTAPFRDPITNSDSQMFGVWVGRRP